MPKATDPDWLTTTTPQDISDSARPHAVRAVAPRFSCAAARLLGIDAGALLKGEEPGPDIPRDGTLLGHLFESLVTLSIRVYAEAAEARIGHLRTRGGRHEVDLIVARGDNRVVACEVKLSRTVDDADVEHLLWLRKAIGKDLLDAVVVTAGPRAYRRKDGIAVIPAALLGP